MGVIDDRLTQLITREPMPPPVLRADVTVHRCEGCGQVLGIERSSLGLHVGSPDRLCQTCLPIIRGGADGHPHDEHRWEDDGGAHHRRSFDCPYGCEVLITSQGAYADHIANHHRGRDGS